MDLRTPEQRNAEWLQCRSNQSNFKNIVILDDFFFWDQDFISEVFGREEFTLLPRNSDIFDVLVFCGCFKSKSDARKNWTKTDKEIEDGISFFNVGKKNLALSIFKPIIR
jgi:hypothetical protein